MKRLASWLIFLFFLYGIMEITAWVSYRLLFGENFSFSRIEGIREQTMAISAMGINQSGIPPIYLVRPYYGYVLNPNWYDEYQREHRGKDGGQALIDDPVNAYGFFGRTPPIQQSDPKKLVVAITGGSVAGFAATWGREEFTAGLSQVPAFRDREIVVLNFGAAAYKQPQQVMVLGDILAQGGAIDLLINIDGYNEIALPRGHDAFGWDVSPFF